MTAAVVCLALGALFTWMAWRHWHYRKHDTINLLEAGILKVTGDEPLPRTRVDHALTYVHAILALLFGSLFLLLGTLGLLSEMGVL